ncbi:ATP-dependent DNA helicase PIF1 [Paraphaeosphaeria minitans]|uniref:ATP-dependent DNA helicase n=1 Tax=Paraphaeosphaeria minitans TaxID=565426 RepID=A0A9P6GHE4_9PLEO|nr:ATP-dependent DNA helicase PIF1 [Paraphaeosphaeria minitans]
MDGAGIESKSQFKKLVKTFNNPVAPPDNPAADIVPIVEPTLCKEQADLMDVILGGRNVFYTGSAGCGKSTMLKAFVKRFEEKGMKVNIIAPTGRAALDINGSTTWTYAGWTPDHHKKPLKDLRATGHGRFVHKRLNETDVLVIDEISMVENHHFERINHLMKEARNDETAFGGVQVVVTGDFCQLPPVKPFRYCIECGRETIVNKEETEYKCRAHGIFYDKDKWAFRSTAWQECDFVHVNLQEIHRQSDRAFINMLNKLRMGIRLFATETDLLLNHESETRNAIQLFATRAEVNRVNEERFRALRSVERTYHCLDHFKWNEAHGNLKSKGEYKAPDGSLQALAEHRFESCIRLKKGMLVVLLHNLDIGAGLVNGSQGTIQGFEDYDPKNLPKAATSREKRDGLPIGAQVLQGDHAVFREWQLQEYAKQMEFKAWPIVRFLNGVQRTIYADCTVNSLGDTTPHSLLSRTQIPLMAAWAMTTHKSQGMTLNRVVVDLSKSFEQGQAYVARKYFAMHAFSIRPANTPQVSRARSLEGLKVVSLPPSAQGSGNPQVKEFLQDRFGIRDDSQ